MNSILPFKDLPQFTIIYSFKRIIRWLSLNIRMLLLKFFFLFIQFLLKVFKLFLIFFFIFLRNFCIWCGYFLPRLSQLESQKRQDIVVICKSPCCCRYSKISL